MVHAQFKGTQNNSNILLRQNASGVILYLFEVYASII